MHWGWWEETWSKKTMHFFRLEIYHLFKQAVDTVKVRFYFSYTRCCETNAQCTCSNISACCASSPSSPGWSLQIAFTNYSAPTPSPNTSSSLPTTPQTHLTRNRNNMKWAGLSHSLCKTRKLKKRRKKRWRERGNKRRKLKKGHCAVCRDVSPPLSEAEGDEWVQCEFCQLRFCFVCLDAPNGDWLCHKGWPHSAKGDKAVRKRLRVVRQKSCG